MITYKFKTNLKCSGCVQALTPFIENVEGLKNWNVDLNNPEKVLSVEGDEQLESPQILNAIQQAGYSGEEI
ncbi:heavy-metal-associated domain-containing protein [Pedobacter flavus]|uniref:Heavy-metal-associated domain-containing protein n=1 Tax=Pedobacter flavus TaxID=3113906 RepID=A0ABU7GYN5_9SPHI|nr:heavy-metal-associated domain-containing protein [Pedobacter sp. VNH31]MEE1884111.1 heavy-metal-associated domain-containing protein [Pedobacter sp. VNH31]